MALERIDKILTNQNIATRSQAKALIKAGKVYANGKQVKKPEEKYDPDTAEIIADGKSLTVKKHLYIMMNKPSGVLSASRDKYAETVIDLLPPELQRKGLFPAGRLDKDTEGLLIITDDGELAHKMLAPKSHVYKLYEAVIDRPLTDDDCTQFKNGLSFGEIQFLPAVLQIKDSHTALVEICEGKFHQVKKMFNAVGANVTHLKRLRIGGVYLDNNLKSGECRELTDREILDLLDKSQDFP